MNDLALQDKLLSKFKPVRETTTARWYIILFILVGIFAWGISGLVTQITGGHIVTGMRDNVVWGVYIVNFIFFMGLSYAGALVSGVLHLFNSEWRKPIIRMAELVTVISLIIGPFFIFFCIGRLDRLHYLFIYPRIQSPISWDVIGITTDLIGCFIYLYLSFIEDFAILRDQKHINLPRWRQKIYKLLALGYTGTPRQKKIIHSARTIMSAMIIAIAIIVYSVLAWIFGVTLQPGWDSTIFGPYFVIAAIFSGTGLMIILMWIFRKIYKLEEFITKKHFVNMGVLLLVIAAFYGYFTFCDYLTKWYGSVKITASLIDKLFAEFNLMFIFANYIGIIIPMIIVGIPRFRTITNITIGAVIAVVALWVNRYIIVVPTLETPFLPIQDSREAWLNYSPTWVEWSLTAAGIAIFIIMFKLASKFLPIISFSEMSHSDPKKMKILE
jgi:molybdopterin-containing oxidoreductase family membrane subunit